ncbi:hypothetical protein [Pseudomonas psychrophila]|uniref:Uncharacterized protein n=1 Tax=Pseudomonas psychrophila TaxID=122355 RepID=A0A8I1FKT9_9PSED|nr:hypothetical protein [Pseudomonas psychrophila]MBJ2256387.1 hypothetical protein [Pseudomonas psychrophila]
MSLYEEDRSMGKRLLAITLIFLAASAACWFGYAAFTKETLDKVTLCPSKGPRGQYVVLIDNTSPFPFTQKAAMGQRLKSMVLNEIPEGYLLSVFLLDEDYKQNESPIFEKCNPGQWGDKNQYTSSKNFVTRDFNEKFAKPLDAVVRKISLSGRSKNSPVFEILQLAGINGFQHSNVQGDKKLVVYSDMMANMPQFSMYKGVLPAYPEFRKTSYGHLSVAPGLEGARVTINLLAADQKTIPYLKLTQFWAEYFEANGASLETIEPMEGL